MREDQEPLQRRFDCAVVRNGEFRLCALADPLLLRKSILWKETKETNPIGPSYLLNKYILYKRPYNCIGLFCEGMQMGYSNNMC